MISGLSGKSGVRGFMLIFVHDILLNAFRESSGIGSFVGDMVQGHIETNVVCFAFESSKHSEHEHDILSGDCLGIYASTEISHTVGSHLSSSYISGIRNRENLLDEVDLSYRSLLFVASNEVGPYCMHIV